MDDSAVSVPQWQRGHHAQWFEFVETTANGKTHFLADVESRAMFTADGPSRLVRVYRHEAASLSWVYIGTTSIPIARRVHSARVLDAVRLLASQLSLPGVV